jgi:hypothetical protein
MINSQLKQSKTHANEIKTRAESEAKQSNQSNEIQLKIKFSRKAS